jgi:hypothetical protein
MYLKLQRFPIWPVGLVLAGLVAAAGCTSRYRLDLFMSVENQERKVKVESTEYIPSAALADPYAETKIVSGGHGVITVQTSARGQRVTEAFHGPFGFDEFLHCRLYLELDLPLKADSVSLTGRSFVVLLGRYGLSPDAKVFLPDDGYCVVDSVTRSELFASMHGIYKNSQGQPLTFSGRFKAKTSH